LDLASEDLFQLDDVGTRIWQLLVEHEDPEIVLQKMLAEFEVDPDTLRVDMEQLLTELLEFGLLTMKKDESDAATP